MNNNQICHLNISSLLEESMLQHTELVNDVVWLMNEGMQYPLKLKGNHRGTISSCIE